MEGGRVCVEACAFASNVVAFKLDGKLVAGRAKFNSLQDGSMFGRWARPAGFRCHSNTPLPLLTMQTRRWWMRSHAKLAEWTRGTGCYCATPMGVRAYHTLCLPAPHFLEIPDGDWFCPVCAESRMEVEVEVEMELMDQCDNKGRDALEASQHVDVARSTAL